MFFLGGGFLQNGAWGYQCTVSFGPHLAFARLMSFFNCSDLHIFFCYLTLKKYFIHNNIIQSVQQYHSIGLPSNLITPWSCPKINFPFEIIQVNVIDSHKKLSFITVVFSHRRYFLR